MNRNTILSQPFTCIADFLFHHYTTVVNKLNCVLHRHRGTPWNTVEHRETLFEKQEKPPGGGGFSFGLRLAVVVIVLAVVVIG